MSTRPDVPGWFFTSTADEVYYYFLAILNTAVGTGLRRQCEKDLSGLCERGDLAEDLACLEYLYPNHLSILSEFQVDVWR